MRTLTAGRVTLAPESTVIEVYLLYPDDLIITERGNIGPGTKADITMQVKATPERSRGSRVRVAVVFRISESAALLGVSADTVRRWVDAGRLPAQRDDHGHRTIAGADLAAFARGQAVRGADGAASSARNRFRGIVTEVIKDGVMAQVEIAAGPFRVVSLMSREAVEQLGLEPGVVAIAVVKSTNVVVELPGT